jgi:nicotinamidase-related amidase
MTEPEQSSQVTLVLIDVINGFAFEGSEGLVTAARRAAPKILALRERAHAAGVPVVYVNDSFGHADFAAVVAASSETDQPGHNVARMLAPTENDQLLLKPDHSAFSCPDFAPLLTSLGARTLVLAGFPTDVCLLPTVDDAHSRGYELLVPADCTAGSSSELTERALERMQATAHARTDDSLDVDLAALRYLVA